MYDTMKKVIERQGWDIDASETGITAHDACLEDLRLTVEGRAIITTFATESGPLTLAWSMIPSPSDVLRRLAEQQSP